MTDGESSVAGVTFDSNGNMFGTTQVGGAYNLGIVWEITASGVYKDLHDFGGKVSGAFGSNQADGNWPTAGVTFDSNGNMFGTTWHGGPLSTGIVWEISASGVYADLHDFGGTITDREGASSTDGLNPHGGIIFDSGGNMYGATQNGGAYGWGIVWEITAAKKYLDLHDFGGTVTDAHGTNSRDGEWCLGSITIDGIGDLFGTASEGGPNGQGMAWELSKSGVYKDLHDFGGNIVDAAGVHSLDGEQPSASVVLDSSGNVYGNTYSGGPNGGGNVWEITPSGVYKDLHDFGGTTTDASGAPSADGASPGAGLTLDAAGNLYGTTINGGSHSAGIVWVIRSTHSYVDLHDFGGTATNAGGISEPDGTSPVTPVTIDGRGNLYGTTYAGGINGSGSVWTLTTFGMTLSPSTVEGGLPATGTITLGSEAGLGGQVVNLSSSNSGITVQSNVTVPQGHSTISFPVGTGPVSSTVTASIGASIGATTVKQPITVLPWLAIVKVTILPTTVVGGAPATGTVTLSAAAPAGGDTVILSSGDPSVTVPANVVVTIGKTSATFPISTIPVSINRSVVISGTSGGVTASATLSIVASLPASPWPKYGQNNSNSGLAFGGGSNGQLRWTYQATGNSGSPPTIGPDGTIYVGTFSNSLIALTPSGSLKWKFTAGGAVTVAPLVGPDGTIYFTAGDNCLYSVNPSGTQNWKFSGSADESSSPAMGPDGTIYFGGDDGNLYAVNPNGTKKWTFATGGMIVASPAIGVDGTIYFGSQDEKFYAVHLDGTLKWVTSLGSFPTFSPAIGPDGTIYTALENGQVRALTSGGANKWSVSVDSGGAIAVVQDGTIYLGSFNGKLTAISRFGFIKWTLPVGSGGIAISLGADGTIYTEFTDWLYAYDPTGTQKWKLQTQTLDSSSPAIGWDGTIYLASVSGLIYAVGTEVNTVKVLSLSLNPSSVLGGNLSSGTVKLMSAAPAGGDVVLLASADPSVALPAFATVAAGSKTATFLIETKAVAANEKVAISATSGGVSVSEKLTVTAGQAQTSPWPKFGQNRLNSGAGVGGGSNGQLKWIYANQNALTSSVAIGSDGTLYFGDNNSQFHAVNPDGSEKWQVFEFGYFGGAPAVGNDGTVYAATESGALIAINPSGTILWTFQISSDFISSVSIGSDGTIYAAATDKNLYAVNPNGTLKWTSPIGGESDGCPAIGTDGTIYVGSTDDNLYAINPDGSLKWKFLTGNQVGSSASVSSDGTVYVGSGDGNLYALNPNGTKKWSFRIGATILSTPTFASDGTIYVGAYDSKVYAINPDGSKKWAVTTGAAVSSSPAIGLDGTVYIGSQDQSLYAINPNGSVLWTFATTGGIYQSPAIGWDGTVYIPSVVFSLYAVGTSVDTVPVSGITLTPATVVGGVAANGVVTLDFAAPPGGAKVALQSNNGAASVPMFISVPAGSLTGAFTVTTAGISASSNAVITAISGGVAASATLKISAAALTALTLSPSTVVDTNPCTGTVTLSGAAPSGGLVVKLKSNSPHATVPATVTVPPGATTATFIITTSASIVSAIADITATYKTVTKSATLKIKT